MKGFLMRPIPCWVGLALSLAVLAVTLFLLIACMVHHDGLSTATRAAVHELAAKGKTDPAEVVRRLQQASDQLNAGAAPSAAVGKMLDINRGLGN